VRSRTSAKAAQTLARHSTVQRTVGRYAQASLYDLTAAVDALRSHCSDGPKDEASALAATGTDGAAADPRPLPETGKISLGPNLGPRLAISGDFQRQAETKAAKMGASENLGNPAVSCMISGVFASEDDGTRTCNHRIDSHIVRRNAFLRKTQGKASISFPCIDLRSSLDSLRVPVNPPIFA
jgi:hypothetical protein